MINKNDQLQEEAGKLIEKGRMKNVMLYEKWSKNEIGCGDPDSPGNVDIRKIMDENPEKAGRMAKALDNQEKHLKTLSEAVIQSTFSTTPENLLKIVKKGVANSNRGEMFTEIQLDTTDKINYTNLHNCPYA